MNPRQIFNLPAHDRILNAVQSDKFQLFAKAGDESVDLVIFEDIGQSMWGDGIGAKDVAAFLSQHTGKTVNVRLNSFGGLAYDGLTIHNALVQHKGDVITTVEGVAASAASIIAMAGSKVRMFANASLMMHRALAIVMGNTTVFSDVADWLNKLDGQIAATYAAKSGRKSATMLKLMDGNVDGTWFSADEALSEGLIDEIIPVRGDDDSAAAGARNAPPINPPGKPDERTQALRASLANEARIKAANAAAARRVRLLEIGNHA